jgi:hypothetical protein
MWIMQVEHQCHVADPPGYLTWLATHPNNTVMVRGLVHTSSAAARWHENSFRQRSDRLVFLDWEGSRGCGFVPHRPLAWWHPTAHLRWVGGCVATGGKGDDVEGVHYEGVALLRWTRGSAGPMPGQKRGGGE